jgi:hypothetical protein
MPDYEVRVHYIYKVQAVNAEDALSTVPIATRLKYANADGLTEIINDEGKTVLRAKLVNNNSKKEEN